MTRKTALEMTRDDYNVSCDIQSRSIINKIYDDLESRSCEKCTHGKKERHYDGIWCDVLKNSKHSKHSKPRNYPSDYCCNRFKGF